MDGPALGSSSFGSSDLLLSVTLESWRAQGGMGVGWRVLGGMGVRCRKEVGGSGGEDSAWLLSSDELIALSTSGLAPTGF